MKKLLVGEKFSVGWFFGWLVATFFHHFLFCHSPVPVHATAVSFNNGWSLEILNQTPIQHFHL
jgi:hypothetical protein